MSSPVIYIATSAAAATTIPSYATDGAFESAKGSSGANGDRYYNTTVNKYRYNENGVWTTVVTNFAYTSKTANYTALVTDRVISLDATAGAFTITLPTAIGFTGLTYTFVKTDATFSTITIDGNAAETINSAATTTLNTQNETLTIMSNGTNWIILSRNTQTAFASYTPTFTGFGTASAIECQWRRSGDCIDLMIRFTAGTCTATEARITYPTGVSASSTKITNIRAVGTIADSATDAPQFFALAESNLTYLTFGYQNGGANAGLTKVNANTAFGANSYSFSCSVPVATWNS